MKKPAPGAVTSILNISGLGATIGSNFSANESGGTNKKLVEALLFQSSSLIHTNFALPMVEKAKTLNGEDFGLLMVPHRSLLLSKKKL
jgi:hypothetical protein